MTLPDVFLCCFWNGQLGQENLTVWQNEIRNSLNPPEDQEFLYGHVQLSGPFSAELLWTLNSPFLKAVGASFGGESDSTDLPRFCNHLFVGWSIHVHTVYKRWQPSINQHGAEEHPGWAMPNRSSKMWCHPPTNAKPTPGFGSSDSSRLGASSLHLREKIPLSKT